MAKRDYYEVLEVTRTVTFEEVKKAYRKKALQYHPDKNPGDAVAEEKFKEATEAYQVLSDQNSRSKYDQFGHAAFEQGGMGGGFSGDFSGFEDIFGDLFGSFFGGGGSGRRSGARGRSGADLRYDLKIEFEEAAFGCEKEIVIPRRSQCQKCEGSGAQKGTTKEKCAQCAGAGQIRIQQGFFTLARTCHVCNGEGQIIRNPCQKCKGSGLEAKETTLKVKVPPGVDNGQRLKMRGEGEPGPQGGTPGDLYVLIEVKEHAIFQRQESEIICEAPISYTTAVLGAEIDVPTLDGPTKMKIPPGTQSGKVFRIKNKGAYILGRPESRGDHHVRVFIHVPKKISPQEKELIAKLGELENKEDQDGSSGFFGRVKEIFS